MKTAIYARKSNDDDRAEENKSVTRHVDNAKAFAEKQGWTVDPDHIYIDDGISGAEFLERPGLLRMMGALKEFNVIVMSELSRLGRDMVRCSVVIDDIRCAGVRIFYYMGGDEELADTPEQRVMVTLKSFAAEVERARTGQRTRDAIERKVTSGHCGGGSCYGYDVVPVMNEATGERLHSNFRINEAEAAVIRGIFSMYMDTYGLTSIAKCLNGDKRYKSERQKYFDGVTHPSPRSGSSCGSWAGSGIRAMLYRTRYIGKPQYGATKKVRGGGGSSKKRAKCDTPLMLDQPEQRIVPQDLWEAAQKRLAATKVKYLRANDGSFWGRPDCGLQSKYLLSGLMRCATCGGNITITGGQKHSHYYYGCSVYQNKGYTVCANDHRERMADIDQAVLSAIENSALTPDSVDYVLNKTMQIVKENLEARPEQLGGLEKEAAKVRRELERFLTMIGEGTAPASVMAEIRRREERLKTLEASIARFQVQAPDELRLKRLRKQAAEHMTKFRELIYGNVPIARQALRKLLRDEAGEFAPMRLNPVVRDGRKTFDFQGELTLGILFNKVGAEERT